MLCVIPNINFLRSSEKRGSGRSKFPKPACPPPVQSVTQDPSAQVSEEFTCTLVSLVMVMGRWRVEIRRTVYIVVYRLIIELDGFRWRSEGDICVQPVR